MKRALRSWWLRLAITLAVVAYLLRRIDARETIAAVSRLDAVTLGLVALLAGVDRALMAWRWILLVRAAGIPLAAKSGIWIFLVSSFLGSFLPAGLGGDVARAWELAQRAAHRSEAVASVALDRWLGLAAVVTLGVFGLANWTRATDPRLATMVTAFLVLIALGSVAGFWADHLLARLLPPGPAARRPWASLVRLASAAAHYRREWPTVAWVSILSFGVQILRVVLAWVIGRGLGIDVAFGYYLVVMPVGIVLILLPISVGGFGPAQGVIVWLLRPLGVPDALSFAMSTLFILTGFVANLPGALLYLTRKH